MAEWIRFVILALVVVAAAGWDLRTSRAPNWLTLGAVALGMLLAVALGLIRMMQGQGWPGLTHELAAMGLGLAAGFVPMAVIFFSGAMGGADVKTMAAVGCISASWPVALETFINAFVIAAAMGIFLMVRHRLVWRTMQRIFGALLVAMARSKPQFKQDSPQVPFLVAVAAGGILAAGRHLLHWPLPWGFNVQ